MPHISIVIPVCRAEACLEELYRRLKAALEPVTTDFEIVLVEDCDLQDRSGGIPRLYAKAQEGFEVVLARSGIYAKLYRLLFRAIVQLA